MNIYIIKFIAEFFICRHSSENCCKL